MSMLSVQLPSLESLINAPEDVRMRKLRGYLFQLTEQLKYILNNLDTENFVSVTAQKIEHAADEEKLNHSLETALTKSEADFQKALSAIIEAADRMTASFSSEMQVLNDSIRSDVSANYVLVDDMAHNNLTLSSRISQNASDVTAAFSRVLELEDAVGNFSNETFSSYIRFDADGIALGRSDSDFHCRLTNERLSFLQGSNEIAYVSNHRLYISDAVIDGSLSLGTPQIGFYNWQREANGSLSLVFHS